MLTQFAPIRHDEVTSFRDDRIHSNILQNLGNVISLSLEINRNGFEVTFGCAKTLQLMLETSEKKSVGI